MFDPLRHPIIFSKPEHLSVHEPEWVGHIPFAFFVVDALRPLKFVELGTHFGVSFCAFCQAIAELGSSAQGYAINTWQKENRNDPYEIEIFRTLQQHHGPLYGHFSQLIQSTFDDALSLFDDSSIDLLHVSGLYTYGATKHIFESWLPKMSDRGVMLFHNIDKKNDDFEVGKFWDELKAKYSSFEFHHSGGLGVLLIGHDIPSGLEELVQAPSDEVERVQTLFAQLGYGLELDNQKEEQSQSTIRSLQETNKRLNAQVIDFRSENDVLIANLQNIYERRSWKFAQFLKELRQRLFPDGSVIDRALRLVLAAIRILAKLPRIFLSEGYRGIVSRVQTRGNEFLARTKKGYVLRDIQKSNIFQKIASNPQDTVVLVSHDARTGGASHLALHITRVLRDSFGKEVIVILLQGGALESDFKKYGHVINLQLYNPDSIEEIKRIDELVAQLEAGGLQNCICNSVVSGSLLPILKKHGFHVISLVHELPTSIAVFNYIQAAKNVAYYSDRIVFPAEFVRQQFEANYASERQKSIVRPQGAYTVIFNQSSNEDARQQLRHDLKIESDAVVFLGCASGDMRKGFDLFIDAAKRMITKITTLNAYFVWIGEIDPQLEKWAKYDIEKLGIKRRVFLLGYVNKPMPIFLGSDVFLLTSREDPFPAVVPMAMDAGIPVIAFEGTGGIPEILQNKRGVVVPYLDVDAMVNAAVDLVQDPSKRNKIVEEAKGVVEKDLDFTGYVKFLLDLLGDQRNIAEGVERLTKKTVSVIIPNYNYEEYLPARISSILNQTYKPHEIIFLDDCSGDNSVQVAKDILEKADIKFSIHTNLKNSGVFHQWIKGIQLAEGELIWIAEADDFCEVTFLESLVGKFNDEEICLGFTQSQVVDENSKKVNYSYTEYTADLSVDKWSTDYSQWGSLEVNEGLAIKNTIPNASAVVFRKAALTGIEGLLSQFWICGDWLTYLYALKNGKIYFCHQRLNYHRRHSKSVINKTENTELFFNELFSVAKFILQNYYLREDIFERMKTHLKNSLVRIKNQVQDRETGPIDAVWETKMSAIDDLPQSSVLKQNQKHRILMILPDLEFGGGQLFGIRLANFLSNANYVMAYSARPSLEHEGVRDIIASSVDLYLGNGSVTDVSTIIGTFNIDTVISHIWWADKLAYYATEDNQNVKWFLVMHGSYEALIEHPEWDADFTKIVGQMFVRADRIIYTANKNLAAINTLVQDKVKSKCVKIDNGFSRPIITSHKVRSEYGIGELDFVFGLISRAIPEKGWEEAIIATERLNKTLNGQNHVHLFLIGESDFEEALRKKYSNNETIHFLGFQKELGNWIEMFDAGLLPTYFQSESQPLIILEFLAQNKPVISTSIGEIPNMLSRNGKKAGIVIPLKDNGVDPEILMRAMQTLVESKKTYSEFKDNCHELFLPYDMKTCGDAYLSIIEKDKEFYDR